MTYNRRRSFNVVLRIPPAAPRLLLAVALLAAPAVELSSEKVTLNTYYPAPSGVYTQMLTTGDTTLARDGGRVGVGTSAPLAKLDVNGGIRLGNVPDAACMPTTEGVLRYNTGTKALEFCNGTAWAGMGGGGLVLGQNNCQWLDWDSKRGALSEAHCPLGKYVAGHVGTGITTGAKKNFGRIYCCEP